MEEGKVLVKYSSYTDAQKKATQKYRENNKVKINEQRKKYYQARKLKDPNFLEYKRLKAKEYYIRKKIAKDAEPEVEKMFDAIVGSSSVSEEPILKPEEPLTNTPVEEEKKQEEEKQDDGFTVVMSKKRKEPSSKRKESPPKRSKITNLIEADSQVVKPRKRKESLPQEVKVST